MCRAVTCKKSGKPSWKWCGAHIEQVLGDVQPDQRYHCRLAPAPIARRKSWFSR